MAAALLAVVWMWRRGGTLRLRSAALVLGSLLFAPQAFYYDLALLALPLVWLAVDGLERGWLPGEKLFLLFGWLSPLAAYLLQKGFPGLPVVPLTLLSLLFCVLRRQRLPVDGEPGA
jgi:hypothetical protein